MAPERTANVVDGGAEVNKSTPQVKLKKGAPTVIFSPVNCSSASE
jgi:hypothetical protein